MTEMEKLLAGEYYHCNSEEIETACDEIGDLFCQYNALLQSQVTEREAILRKAFGSVGKSPRIKSPFQCDIGRTTHIGDYFFANYNCCFLDGGGLYIGDHVLVGPNTGIYTPEHAFDPELRAQGYEVSKPVRIGNHVWIGGGVSILGGVTIGDNTIIGAGSVVTHDIPANVIAAGNPCRVIREITEEDKKSHAPKPDKRD